MLYITSIAFVKISYMHTYASSIHLHVVKLLKVVKKSPTTDKLLYLKNFLGEDPPFVVCAPPPDKLWICPWRYKMISMHHTFLATCF